MIRRASPPPSWGRPRQLLMIISHDCALMAANFLPSPSCPTISSRLIAVVAGGFWYPTGGVVHSAADSSMQLVRVET